MRSRHLLGLIVAAQCSGVHAQWKLAGDQQPNDPPLWQKPATISHTKVDGKSTGNVDADLRYAFKSGPQPSVIGLSSTSYAAGVYVHRTNAEKAPKNDRGGSLKIGKVYRFGQVDPTQNDSASTVKRIDFIELSLSIKAGKTFVSDKDAAGAARTWDKKTLRVVAQGDYYLIPKTADKPLASDIQFNIAGGAYEDLLSGTGAQSGNLSGAFARARIDWAFRGLNPGDTKVSEGLGFAPVLYVSTQVQRDFADSGDRQKEQRILHAIGLSLNFAKLGDSGLVPSLVLERSVGADLLVGRAKSGKTLLALGVAF
jgi:hypothetical protein